MVVEEFKKKLADEEISIKHRNLEKIAYLELLEDLLRKAEFEINYHEPLLVEGAYDTYHNPKFLAGQLVKEDLEELFEKAVEMWNE